MNEIDFNESYKYVKYTLDSINNKICNNSIFNIDDFNVSIQKIAECLKNDINFCSQPQSTISIANRIYKYQKLYIKIKDLQTHSAVLNVSCILPKILILNDIVEKYKELTRFIEKHTRLPYQDGNRKYLYRKAFQDSLPTLLRKKEFFHFLGNYFDPKYFVDTMKFEKYETNYDFCTQSSWQRIINLFQSSGNPIQKKECTRLLSMFNKSLKFAFKILYINKQQQQIFDSENIIDNANYFKLYSKFTRNKNSKKQFDRKYTLSNNAIPKSVLLNNLAWDILDDIKELNSGDSMILPLGSVDHTIIVQITCKNVNDYEYIIFNTGTGHSLHKVKSNVYEAYPVTYINLNRSHFTYSFFSNLLSLAFENKNIVQFYQLHQSNFTIANKRLEEGKPYPLQNYKICTSTAIEAFLINFLNEDDYKKLEKVKITFTLRKQQEVVDKLKREVEEASWCVVKGKSIYRDKTVQTKIDEYEENRYLLNLGKRMATACNE
jgi:hypothetical protein